MNNLYTEHGKRWRLTPKEKRANVLLTVLTNAAYQLVNEHDFSAERVHELVDRALTV